MRVLVVKNHNEEFKCFYERFSNKGKYDKVIIEILMRKLLPIFFGMLKHTQKFNQGLV